MYTQGVVEKYEIKYAGLRNNFDNLTQENKELKETIVNLKAESKGKDKTVDRYKEVADMNREIANM